MNNGNVGFNLPMGKPPRGSRQAKLLREEKGERVDPAALREAVSYVEEAAAGATGLTDAIRELGIAANALLKSGLKPETAALLIQSLMKNQRNGRPQPTSMILEVLYAAARVGEHLE